MLRLDFKDDSIIAAIGVVDRFQGPAACGQPLASQARVLRLSRGNPLVRDINRGGIAIPAGEKFSFLATLLIDSFAPCNFVSSFTPKAGATYELYLASRSLARVGEPPLACEAKLFEIGGKLPDGKESREELPLALEACTGPDPRKN